ncbi:MAG: membrane protein insertion efficiency factor YidD [Treponema sp.]
MKVIRFFSSVLVFLLTLAIIFYKKAISLHFRPVCRFYPSCSTYALESIKKYGAFKGLYLATRRLLRCHPFHKGGYDSVP